MAGLGPHVSREFDRDGDVKLIGIAATDEFLFDHDFFERKILMMNAC